MVLCDGPAESYRTARPGWHFVTAAHSPVNLSISLFEKRDELRRILQSKYFAGSPKKSRFLEFVAEQTFIGNGDKLNEYLIGVEVYNRGPAFDSQKDPIVRVQAHEIRRLLKIYYEDDGKDSLMRVDLPAGAYIPVFSRADTDAPRVAAEQVGVRAQPGWSPSRVHLTITVALGLLCLCLGGMAVWRPASKGGGESSTHTLPAELDWFWHPFLPPADAPIIAIPNHPLLRAAHDGDSAQTLARAHLIPKSELPEFRDTIHFRELKQFRFVPSTTDFTSVGETMGAVNLCGMFYRVRQGCRVQQSRLVNMEEIKANNAILLGGNQSWSGRVFLNLEGFHFQSGIILNRSPHSGEQAVYKPEFDPITNQLRRDYALILMLPNERSNNRVLLIYGIYTQGSQAAIEYLTNPERMAELRKALVEASPDHKSIPPYFQALLSTTVENALPGICSLVALRIIPE